MNTTSDSKSKQIPLFLKFIAKQYVIFFACLFLVIAGLLTYRQTFQSPFVFDDYAQILENPNIANWPGTFWQNNRRPILYATLAWDLKKYGLNPEGFHIFNVRVHILGSIVLFFLGLKTCRLPSTPVWVRRSSFSLSFSAALLWLLHPLQTQSVTYIIQRAESLMGLFFLLSWLCASQYLTSRKAWALGASMFFGLLSSLTKEVAIVLPIVILFYDRCFISSSWGAVLRHWRLYAGLTLNWVVMIWLFLTTHPELKLTAGFGMADMPVMVYAFNQPAVIWHYLHLVIWPANLVFDYNWPVVLEFSRLWFPVFAMGVTWTVLIMISRQYSAISFLGGMFFIILLPSLSFIPLEDLSFEHRLYLSLGCAAFLFVILLKFLFNRFSAPNQRGIFFNITIAALAISLSILADKRNMVYSSEESIWQDVVKKRPANDRAWINLGELYMRKGKNEKAKDCFLKAISLNSKHADTYSNLAAVYAKEGDLDQALSSAQKAVSLEPDMAEGYNNLGSVLSQKGDYAKAVLYFERALQMGFVREGVIYNLCVALKKSGKNQEAIKILDQFISRNPEFKILQSLKEKWDTENKAPHNEEK